MYHVSFAVKAFHYTRITDVLPLPSGVMNKGDYLIISYVFRGGLKSHNQRIRFGLLKATIADIIGGDEYIAWNGEALSPDADRIYEINSFVGKYARFKTWPRWIWPKHRGEIESCLWLYARRLMEKDMLYIDILFGAAGNMNSRLKKKITKRKSFEKLVHKCYARTKEAYEKGILQKPLKGEALSEARSAAGKNGGTASGISRKTKAEERQRKIFTLFPSFLGSDLRLKYQELADELDCSVKTIRNDLSVCMQVSVESVINKIE